MLARRGINVGADIAWKYEESGCQPKKGHAETDDARIYASWYFLAVFSTNTNPPVEACINIIDKHASAIGIDFSRLN